MTADTARHLTRLLHAAHPITVDETERTVTAPGQDYDYVLRIVSPILDRHTAAAQAAEIRSAAAERREAHAIADSGSHKSRDTIQIYDYGFSALRWTLALPEILAAVAADNAHRLAEYEAYRIACEQGVAVPPM